MNSTHSPAESGGISAAQAQEIAERVLATLKPEHRFTVLPARTQERAFGWVFFYAPAKYLETGERSHLTPGNGPLVVYRQRGNTEFLSTSVPPAKAIEVLEQRLAAQAAAAGEPAAPR